MGFWLNVGRALAGKEKPQRDLLEDIEEEEYEVDDEWTETTNKLIEKADRRFHVKGTELRDRLGSAVLTGSEEINTWDLDEKHMACALIADYHKRDVKRAVIIEARKNESKVNVLTRPGNDKSDADVMDKLIFSMALDERDARVMENAIKRMRRDKTFPKDWDEELHERKKKKSKRPSAAAATAFSYKF